MADNRFNYGLPAQIISDFGPEDAVSAQLMEDPNNQKRRLLPRALAGSSLTNNAAAMANLSARAERAITEGLDLYKQPDDYRAAEEFGRQRAQQGEADMLNAFAAQIAPKRFAPLGEAFLKKALAAQEPVKVGSATIGADGQIIRDPSAERLKQAESKLKLGEFLTGQVGRMRDDENTQVQRDFMNNLAVDRANNPHKNDSQNFRQEDILSNQFNNLTKDLRDQVNTTKTISDVIGAYAGQTSKDLPAVTQQSLVILLNKFLDPGSVVREGEFDRVIQSQGWDRRAGNLINRLREGKPLDTGSISEIKQLSEIYNKAAISKIQNYGRDFGEKARRRGYDPHSVVTDPSWLPEDFDTSTAAPNVVKLR